MDSDLFRCHRVSEVPSTQDLARQLYDGKPLLVIADRQTAGRGRQGTRWENAPLAMASSFMFSPKFPQEAWGLIPLVAGLAAAEQLEDSVRLKWPNDLIRQTSEGAEDVLPTALSSQDGAGSGPSGEVDQKLGGILVEAEGEEVVVGWGLNLYWPSAPLGWGGLFSQAPTQDAVDLRQVFSRSWAKLLWETTQDDPQHWPRLSYEQRCVTLGAEISWKGGGSGTAMRIGPGGELVVSTSTGIEHLRAGAVSHVRTV